MLKEQTNIAIEPCRVLSSPRILKDILLFTFSPIMDASGSAIANIRKEIVIWLEYSQKSKANDKYEMGKNMVP